MSLDFEPYRKKIKPTKKQVGLYKSWVKYLTNSRLTQDEIHKRASAYASRGEKVPKE